MGLQCGELETIMQSEVESEHPDFPFKKDMEVYYI